MEEEELSLQVMHTASSMVLVLQGHSKNPTGSVLADCYFGQDIIPV